MVREEERSAMMMRFVETEFEERAVARGFGNCCCGFVMAEGE